jgi:hypothetical protein
VHNIYYMAWGESKVERAKASEGRCTGEERCKHTMSCVQARSGTACKHTCVEAEACWSHARGEQRRREEQLCAPTDWRLLESSGLDEADVSRWTGARERRNILEKKRTASPFLLKVVGLLPTPFFLLFSCAPGRNAAFTIPFRKDEKHSTENSEATIYTGRR